MRFNLAFLVSTALAYAADGAITLGGSGLNIDTQQGVVLGTQVLPSVRQFLGIPYANAKRWTPPSKPPIRTKPLAATSFGDTCVQLLTPANVEILVLAGAEGINVSESENCLTVNIWAPSTARKQNAAVMIWIYGGAFQFGTSNLPTYNGQNFVRDHDDVIIVTFNYRLNIFGQPNAPQLASGTQSQNFGLLDRDAAIQWVHDNIASFGGNPNRIVLFGQSAGAVSADAYTFSHPKDSLVRGVIQQSGNLGLITTAGLGNPTLDPTSWNTLAESLRCGNTLTPAQFACMQAIPFRTLENAVVASGLSFNLLIDNITIFSDVAERAVARRFSQVPVLGGSTLNEDDIFAVAQTLVINGATAPFITEVVSDLVTQVLFTCTAGATAQQRIKAGVPTWRYQYQAVFPDISTRSDLRSFHASEIPIVFATYNSSRSTVRATAAEVSLSRSIQTAWVAFARDPEQGLLELGWPRYDPKTNTLAQLGNPANATGITFTSGALLDATCSSAAQLSEMANQLSTLT